MATQAIVRVSFQSKKGAQVEVREALTKGGQFEHVNTAVYTLHNGNDEIADGAIDLLLDVIKKHRASLDFLSITMTRHPPTNPTENKPVTKT